VAIFFVISLCTTPKDILIIFKLNITATEVVQKYFVHCHGNPKTVKTVLFVFTFGMHNLPFTFHLSTCLFTKINV